MTAVLTHPQALLAHMREHQKITPDTRFYALADTALNEDLVTRLQKNGHNTGHDALYNYSQHTPGPPVAVSPVLLPLESLQGAGLALFGFLHQTEHVAAESFMFIAASSPINVLARHLAQFDHVTLANKEQNLLRFHDPNLFAAFLDVSDPTIKHQFLAPLSALWYADVDGHNFFQSGLHQAMPEPLVQQHTWTAQQQAQFIRLTQPRAMMAQLEQDFGVMPLGIRKAWLADITQWLQDARTHQATAPKTQWLYCTLAMMAGGAFTKNEAVAEELLQVGHSFKHADFESAMAAVAPDVWERLRSSPALRPSTKA